MKIDEGRKKLTVAIATIDLDLLLNVSSIDSQNHANSNPPGTTLHIITGILLCVSTITTTSINIGTIYKNNR